MNGFVKAVLVASLLVSPALAATAVAPAEGRDLAKLEKPEIHFDQRAWKMGFQELVIPPTVLLINGKYSLLLLTR